MSEGKGSETKKKGRGGENFKREGRGNFKREGRGEY